MLNSHPLEHINYDFHFNKAMELLDKLRYPKLYSKLKFLIEQIEKMKQDLDRLNSPHPRYLQRLNTLSESLKAIIDLTKNPTKPESMESYMAQANNNFGIQKRQLIVAAAIVVITSVIAVAISPYLLVLAPCFLAGLMIGELLIKDENSFSEKQKCLSISMKDYASEIKRQNRKNTTPGIFNSHENKTNENKTKQHPAIVESKLY